jgi:hypothetical protein
MGNQQIQTQIIKQRRIIMADENRPEEGNVINLHEVDRYNQDRDFNNEMNYLGLMLNNLAKKSIGTFAIIADDKMVTSDARQIDYRAFAARSTLYRTAAEPYLFQDSNVFCLYNNIRNMKTEHFSGDLRSIR